MIEENFDSMMTVHFPERRIGDKAQMNQLGADVSSPYPGDRRPENEDAGWQTAVTPLAAFNRRVPIAVLQNCLWLWVCWDNSTRTFQGFVGPAFTLLFMR